MPARETSQTIRQAPCGAKRNTFNITYDPVDVFVVVAGEDRVGGGIELIQGTWRDFERHRELHARPVVLPGVESLDVARTFGEVLVELQQSGENVAFELRREANRVDFLLFFQRDDELVGILQKQKKKQFLILHRLNFCRTTHVSGFVGSNADNIRIRPSVGQVEFIGVVGGDAVRSDGQDALVLAFPGGVLCHEKALQFNILMYFARCSHYLSLRGAL